MPARWLSAQDDLTIHRIDALAPELIAAACSGDRLRIDLSGIDRIDTAGIQLLTMLRREALRCATELVFENPSAAVLELVAFYQLADLLCLPPPVAQPAT